MSECFATVKVLGDPTAELPTPNPDCVECAVNMNCHIEYGKISKRQEVERVIKETGTWVDSL